MSIIKAPYNFVPFNKTTVIPHWANEINHDLPFQDGLSGEIEITLTAESPIFIKDGMGQEEAKTYRDDDGKQVKHYGFSFSERHGSYFIPSTSVKGMVRNVLEILTFGKMDEKVNDHKYALRDLSSKMKEIYLKPFKPDKIFCGWLIKKEDSYIIIDCDLPGRISHKELDETLETEFVKFTTKVDNFSTQNKSNKSAQKKYALLGDRDQLYSFTRILNNDPRDMYAFDSLGAKKGRLVFTGQPGVRKNINGKWTGHHLEFIFFEDGNKIERKVDSKVIDNFLFAYYEHDKTKWSPDWKVWRQKLQNGQPVPVFFQKDGDEIIHLGLSYLYKLPYKYSVRDSIREHQKAGGLDMSEAIFGHVQKNDALKGRVTFDHAFATAAAEEDESKQEVLAAPKASYYPNYIRQELRNGSIIRGGTYQTFMDRRAEIAGWKRYPIRSNVSSNAGTDNVKTRFIPLKTGAQFKCTIHYHNLRPIELGALLSALTFHGSTDTYHSIGMAKPLGYGKIKLSIDEAENIQIEKLMGEFEAYMNVKLDHAEPKWHQSPQITELVTMAQEHQNVDLSYMGLQEHVDAKKAGEALDKYSVLTGIEASITSHCNAADILQVKVQVNKESGLSLHQAYLPELILTTQTNAKKELEEAFENRKRELIRQLRDRRKALEEAEKKAQQDREQQEREAKKIETQQRAAQEGPAFQNVLANKKDAFDQLKKLVEDFGRKYHNVNDKALRNNFPDGFLPTEYHEELVAKLKAIHSESLSKREKDKWKNPFDKNPVLKKVAEWIGMEQAMGIHF
jgi:CRISPR-associated protein (TIGR03986 family)